MSDLPEVHVSDISTFRNCRWRWDWSSNLRQYLERKEPVPHFMLGRAVHFAMSAYYDGEDALNAYESYIEKDLALSDHLDTMVDIEAKSKIVESVVLGRGMTIHYLRWAPPRDEMWECLSTEQTEEMEVDGYKWRSRFDGIWRYKPDGTLWLKEFKTTRSMKEMDFIYRDPQPMLYQLVAQEVLGQEIEGTLYTFMWKKVPQLPRRLKDGSWSKAEKQNTTAELYIVALKQMVEEMGIPPEEEERMYDLFLKEYAETISFFQEQKDKFFLRKELKKTQSDLQRNLEWLDKTAQQMIDPDVDLYPAPSQMKCPRCPFDQPCRIRFSGGDYSGIIEEEFRRRDYWDEKLRKENVNDS